MWYNHVQEVKKFYKNYQKIRYRNRVFELTKPPLLLYYKVFAAEILGEYFSADIHLGLISNNQEYWEKYTEILQARASLTLFPKISNENNRFQALNSTPLFLPNVKIIRSQLFQKSQYAPIKCTQRKNCSNTTQTWTPLFFEPFTE